MEPSTRIITTTRPKGLSAEQLVLFQRLLSFLDSQHAPRRIILSLMKTTADLVQKSQRRMSSIFFKVEAARVFLDYWQDNSVAQSLKQQQIMYSQRHGGQARELAILESHTKTRGLQLGLDERHKIAMHTYKGIKKLDNETNGWSRTIVKYVEAQASDPDAGTDHGGENQNQKEAGNTPTPWPNKGKDRRKFPTNLTAEGIQTHRIIDSF